MAAASGYRHTRSRRAPRTPRPRIFTSIHLEARGLPAATRMRHIVRRRRSSQVASGEHPPCSTPCQMEPTAHTSQRCLHAVLSLCPGVSVSSSLCCCCCVRQSRDAPSPNMARDGSGSSRAYGADTRREGSCPAPSRPQAVSMARASRDARATFTPPRSHPTFTPRRGTRGRRRRGRRFRAAARTWRRPRRRPMRRPRPSRGAPMRRTPARHRPSP